MEEVAAGLLLLALACFLLVCVDRMFRINPLLESFEGSANSQCGVDLPPCDFGLQCINGYCKTTRLPAFPSLNDLPVLP